MARNEEEEHKKAEELRVFEQFASACPLDIDTSTVEQPDPPHPDIRCEAGGEPTAFELTEVVCQSSARRRADLVRLTRRARDAFLMLPEESQAVLRWRGFRVEPNPDLTLRRKESAIDRLVPELASRPLPSRGPVPLTPELRDDFAEVSVIGRHPWGDPHFHIPCAGSVGEPVVESIVKKLRKTYSDGAPVEVLAYYSHDEYSFELRRDELTRRLTVELARSRIRRVWVFGRASGRILLVHPPWSETGAEPSSRGEPALGRASRPVPRRGEAGPGRVREAFLARGVGFPGGLGR